MNYRSIGEESRDTVASEYGDPDPSHKDNSGANGEENVDYDDALNATGYGLFHYILVTVGGLAHATYSTDILCASILMPAAECDLHMTSAQKGWLSSMVFLGMLVGGYIFGSLGDIYGRHTLLRISHAINGLADLTSTFAQSYELFIVLRFIGGMGFGGSSSVVWAYVSEFQPAHRRGGALSVIALFWPLGNVLVAVLALLTIPYDIGFVSPGFSYNSWRLFITLCTLPSLTNSILLIWLPESPMFLLMKGRQEEALDILKMMYTQNTKKSSLTYPVKSINTAGLHIEQDSQRNCWDSFSSLFLSTWRHTSRLFSRALFRVTVLFFFINFTLYFGYFGLWLWFPELFNRLQLYNNEHPDAKVSVCDLQNYEGNATEISLCDTGTPSVDTATLYNTLIIAVTSIPSKFITICCMDRLGRKFFLVLSMVTSGVAACTIYFVKTTVDNLIVNCVFGALSALGFSALHVLGAELFPTDSRTTGKAITTLVSGIGSISGTTTFGYLVDQYCAIPMFLVASSSGWLVLPAAAQHNQGSSDMTLRPPRQLRKRDKWSYVEVTN